MKMKLSLVTLIIAVLLPGCSLLESINNSLNYVDEATTYVNETAGFAERVPAIAEQAVNNPQAMESFKNELEGMKTKIVDFNVVEPPAIAQEIHQKLVGYNEIMMQEINSYLEKINNGIIDLRSIEDSPLFQTIHNITDTLNQLEQLGQ